MHKIKILILLIFVFNCKNNSNENDRSLKSDTFAISKAKLNGQKLILSAESLNKIYGKPTQVIDSCFMSQLYSDKIEFVMTCNLYDKKWDLVYRNYQKTSFLGHLNFRKTNYELKLPNITLSKETSLSELRSVFPKPHINSNGIDSDGYEWIYFYDDLSTYRRSEPNIVRLGFKNGKLVHFNYDWIPEYSESEYNKYMKWKEQGSS